MAQIYTNCSSCCFLEQSNCKLNKHNSSGFSGLVDFQKVDSGEYELHVLDRVCTFHRTKHWKSFMEERNIDIYELVKKENKLNYGLVTCIDNRYDPDTMLNQLKSIVESEHKPKNIYLVNNSSNTKYDNSYLKGFLQDLGLPYKIKKALSKLSNEKFIDEFAVTERIINPFYLGLLKPGFNIEFLEKLHHMIHEDMLQVIFAGDDSEFYYMPTAIHKLCSSGFKKFLEREIKDGPIYSYDNILGR